MSLLRKILKESIPILLFTTIGGVIAGVVLEDMRKDLILKVPGLLVLLPAILGMRGNISGALGSRLASALHLGLIDPRLRWNETLSDNVSAAIILNIIMSFLLGIIAYYTYVVAGFREPASILQLTAISLITGIMAGLILALLTVITAAVTFGHGIDPDNVLMPILSTVGDIITILCLIIAVRLVLFMSYI